ncbi:hypothetical protein LWI29_019041 [Acer saccharum]|uniref:Uncharacterized protein n=1 Tax=Acer saccharum TaxID=4024 RepID=A0AA39ST94_ACESA|nr:hypothetical protein LWI29_019041 [Acer saccharum]
MARFVQSIRRNSSATPRFFSLLHSFSQNGRRGAITCIGMSTRYLSSGVEVSEFEHDEPHDESITTEKNSALRLALSQLAKAGDFGSLKLDLALGIGGLPKGRIVEIYGREASGKTTLALHVIKEAQNLGGYCAYLDVENAIDPSLVKEMGVDTQNLLIAHPDSAENLLSMVDTLTKSGSVDVIVVDSVAALVPKCEIDAPVGGVYRDVQSKIMTQALRKINYSLCQSRTLLIFLNQVRASVKPGQGFGRIDEETCGGNALKFYAAVRLRMMRTGLLKTEDEITGLGVCVEVVKNKLAPAMNKAYLGINFGKGFCSEQEALELACEHGLVVQEGSNYIIGRKVFSGKYSAEQYLIENERVLDKIVMILRQHLFERKRKV